MYRMSTASNGMVRARRWGHGGQRGLPRRVASARMAAFLAAGATAWPASVWAFLANENGIRAAVAAAIVRHGRRDFLRHGFGLTFGQNQASGAVYGRQWRPRKSPCVPGAGLFRYAPAAAGHARLAPGVARALPPDGRLMRGYITLLRCPGPRPAPGQDVGPARQPAPRGAQI